MFPNMRDLSPEAARILVTSLNRGVEDRGYTRISKSPTFYFGSDFGFAASGFPTLSPALAVELAKYEGILAIQRLGELPDESAAALAKVPGVLQIQLRELDSVSLAQWFAHQINSTLSNLETVSQQVAPASSQYKQFFNLRALTVMESPELARRFVDSTTSGNGITLPARSTLSAEAAEILAAGSKSRYLGMMVIESSAVAWAFANSKQEVKLPRLRAATPEVIEILEAREAD